MLFKKYLLVFTTLLLAGGNLSFSGEHSESTSNKTYVRKSKSINPIDYRRNNYALDNDSENIDLYDLNAMNNLRKKMMFGDEDNNLSHSVNEIKDHERNIMLSYADDEDQTLGAEYDDSEGGSIYPGTENYFVNK